MIVDCREATELTSAELDRPLTFRERARLTAHRIFCAPCRAYRRQLETLRGLATRLSDAPPAGEEKLPDDARARIRERLRDARD